MIERDRIAGSEELWYSVDTGMAPFAGEDDRQQAKLAMADLVETLVRSDPDVQPEAEEDFDAAEVLTDACTRLLYASLRLWPQGDNEPLHRALPRMGRELGSRSLLDAVLQDVRYEFELSISRLEHIEKCCQDLAQLRRAPDEVLDEAKHLIQMLGQLRAAAAAVDEWRENPSLRWAAGLELPELWSHAEAGLEKSPSHLWPLAGLASASGLEGLFPSLRSLLAQGAGISSSNGRPGLRQLVLQCQPPAGQSQEAWRESLVGDIMSMAARGRLCDEDMQAVREAVIEEAVLVEGRRLWAEKHREALARGFAAPLYLVKLVTGSWTAQRSVRLSSSPEVCFPRADRRLLRRPEGEAPAIADDAQEVQVVADLTPADELATIPRESFALATWRLHLAGVELSLFGDDHGLWCLVRKGAGGTGNEWIVRCQSSETEVLDDEACIPLYQIGGGIHLRKMRLGPLAKIDPFAGLQSAYSDEVPPALPPSNCVGIEASTQQREPEPRGPGQSDNLFAHLFAPGPGLPPALQDLFSRKLRGRTCIWSQSTRQQRHQARAAGGSVALVVSLPDSSRVILDLENDGLGTLTREPGSLPVVEVSLVDSSTGDVLPIGPRGATPGPAISLQADCRIDVWVASANRMELQDLQFVAFY